MLVTIAKEFTFDAAHRLENLPATHKCYHLHGHTYRVELVLQGAPDALTGFVIDYAEIAEAWRPLHDVLDHSYLNNIAGLGGAPSTEHLAAWIWERLRVPKSGLVPTLTDYHPGWTTRVGELLLRVRVSESVSTWAEVSR